MRPACSRGAVSETMHAELQSRHVRVAYTVSQIRVHPRSREEESEDKGVAIGSCHMQRGPAPLQAYGGRPREDIRCGEPAGSERPLGHVGLPRGG